MMNTEFEPVIGLEVHVQLKTQSKIFCGCATTFGAEANTQTCPVCLGLPGALPVMNRQAVEFAVRMGLATNCQIRRLSRFARKNYFYPDLPKGYQISQFDEPICENGFLEIEVDGRPRTIRLRRIHLEEDAGKSVHDEKYVSANDTLIDLNRCGTPLIEIVSEPDFRSAQEAAIYLQKLRQLVRYLGISDGNMEEGSLRCDANVSMRPAGQIEYGVRTELKNMNSFSHVEKAIQFEIDRQSLLLKAGQPVEQETLLWDVQKNEARSMRGKEESHDYRYFPEPDLPPLLIDAIWLEQIQRSLAELPDVKKQRFQSQYKLNDYDSRVLTASRDMSDYFEQAAKTCADFKLVSNWLMGEVSRALNEQKLEINQFPISADRLAGLLNFITDAVISSSAAKKVFDEMLVSNDAAEKIIDRLGLKQVSDANWIESLVDQVLTANPKEVEGYRQGKTKLLGFFVGQVMRASQGKASPALVNEMVERKIKG